MRMKALWECRICEAFYKLQCRAVQCANSHMTQMRFPVRKWMMVGMFPVDVKEARPLKPGEMY